MLKIIADEQIQGLEVLREIATVIRLPYQHITRKAVQDADADAVLVRSVTAVNQELLAGTRVSFVGSTAAGFDRVDTDWLAQQSIQFAVASGANRVAVAEYVLCCMAELRKRGLLIRDRGRAAIIGMGQVGSCVADRLKIIGMEVMYYDPFNPGSTALSKVTAADFISIHAPLTKNGPHPTFHLMNHDFLAQLKPGCVVLNAGRGEIIDTAALLKNTHIKFCLDVFENEPDINLSILKQTVLATPHIAGYSKQAKLNATNVIITKLLDYFNIYNNIFNKNTDHKKMISIKKCDTWEDVLLRVYQPADDMKRLYEVGFEKMRREYQWRDEFSAIQLFPTPAPLLQSVLHQLGFSW